VRVDAGLGTAECGHDVTFAVHTRGLEGHKGVGRRGQASDGRAGDRRCGSKAHFRLSLCRPVGLEVDYPNSFFAPRGAEPPVKTASKFGIAKPSGDGRLNRNAGISNALGIVR